MVGWKGGLKKGGGCKNKGGASASPSHILPTPMRSKPNRERLDSSRVTSVLYTRAALNTPNSHISSSHEFLKEDDHTEK